jgi:molecular chaperone GrpE
MAEETRVNVGEAEETPPESGTPPETAEAAKATELELLSQRLEELNDSYLRLRAEYDNYRKRSQKEREDIYPAATANALAKFLPVFDNIERAAGFPHGDDDFGKGFDLICQSLRETLQSVGVERFGEAGESFDPAAHHAVMHTEDDTLGENVVATVLQRGYRLGDRVIRYAMVQTAN